MENEYVAVLEALLSAVSGGDTPVGVVRKLARENERLRREVEELKKVR